MQKLKRTNYQKPFIILFIVVGLTVSILSLGVFIYNETVMENKLDKKTAHSEFMTRQQTLQVHYSRFKFLLNSVAHNDEFLAYIDQSDAKTYDNACRIFYMVADSHPSIMRLRFLDINGKEKIRIERARIKTHAHIVSPEQLQDKSDREYFIDTLSKAPGELFTSRIDLNLENGGIELPYNPILRIAMPIYRGGKIKGILIVNLFMSEVLHNLITSSSFYIYLYDQNHHIIQSNDPVAGEWGRYSKTVAMVNPKQFVYTNQLFSSPYETLSLGFKSQKKAMLLTLKDQKIFLILIGLILPISFILAYFVAKIPKKLFDALEERESLMIQQSKMAAMGEMIGAIAHQWRQPLNAIGVLAQEIELRYQYGNLEKEDLKTIVKELMDYLVYMSKTIDDFRNFFKPTKQKAVFDVLSAINEAKEMVSKQLETHSIDLTITSAANGPFEIDGYENEFKQVIINLLNNAKEAIEGDQSGRIQKGKIDIFIERDKEKIIIHIKDNGGGISEMIMDTIFDPYISTKHEQQGTGIGLYLAQLIIERNMLGSIRATNAADGAYFTITLPAVSV